MPACQYRSTRFGVLVASLLVLSASPVALANPFRFLMMMNKDEANKKARGGTPTMKAPSENDNNDKMTCIAPQALERTQAELATALSEKEEAIQQLEKAKNENLKLRKDFEEREGEFYKERDSSHLLARLHEDLTKRTAEMQAKFDVEKKELKDLLRQKDEEKEQLHNKLEAKAAEQEKLIEKKLKEAEALWERGLASVENTSIHQVKEMQNEHKAKIKEQEQKYQKIIEEEQQKAHNVEREKDMVKGEKKAIEMLYEALEKKYEHVLQNMEGETEKYKTEHFEAAVNERTEQMLANWTKRFSALETKSRQLLEEAQERSKQELDKALSDFQDAQNKHEEALAMLAADHEKQLRDSEDKMRQSELRFAAKLQEARNKHQEEMTKQAVDHEKQLNDAGAKIKQSESRFLDLAEEKKTVDKALVAMQEDLETTKELVGQQRRVIENLESAATDIKALYKKTLKDAMYWENKFEHRSYFNSTQVWADSLQKYDTVAAVATEYLQKQRQLVAVASEPYVKHLRELYDTHLKTTVDRTYDMARPHYDQQVAPLVEQAKTVLQQARQQARILGDDIFKELVAKHKLGCTTITWMKCSEPELFVATFLKVLAFVILFALRGVIWGLFWGSVKLVLGIIWFFSPLRWLIVWFSRKLAQPPASNSKAPTSNSNGVEKKTRNVSKVKLHAQ